MNKYLDKQGLLIYNQKIKQYINNKVNNNSSVKVVDTVKALPEEIVDFVEIVPPESNKGDVIIGYNEIQ